MHTVIKKLRAMPIHGNAHHDRPVFDACDTIIKNPRFSFEVRAQALKHIDKVMGEKTGKVTKKQLREYLACCT